MDLPSRVVHREDIPGSFDESFRWGCPKRDLESRLDHNGREICGYGPVYRHQGILGFRPTREWERGREGVCVTTGRPNLGRVLETF